MCLIWGKDFVPGGKCPGRILCVYYCGRILYPGKILYREVNVMGGFCVFILVGGFCIGGQMNLDDFVFLLLHDFSQLTSIAITVMYSHKTT